MEEGNLIVPGYCALCVICLLPFIGTGIILALRSQYKKKNLARGILLTGLTAGLLPAIPFVLFPILYDVFKARDVSIYEGLVRNLIWFFWLGYGIGTVGASVIVIPIAILTSRIKSKQSPHSPFTKE